MIGLTEVFCVGSAGLRKKCAAHILWVWSCDHT